MLEILKNKNKHLNFIDVKSDDFKIYGNIINDIDFKDLIDYAEKNAIIRDGITYERMIEDLQNLPIRTQIEKTKYAQMPIQIGWCIGKNSTMNGLEYHKGNEIVVACSDLCLFLGYKPKINNNTYNVKDVVATFLKKGEAVELYSTTMHLAPVQVSDSGFKAIIILPLGTNEPIDFEPYKSMSGEDRLIFAKNKWMIAHSESGAAKRGAFVGIVGENLRLYY